ncbi:38766_t:CDS:10 [Gigaspora margarita]|uniref:38766_t:CDS:1 n=1 Tax=Gigaspora margarita TaxID=4874 RepID=A0ABM8VXS1_GIGMA|nr:38766_t:CDS:10 [Gigaspora margarita]
MYHEVVSEIQTAINNISYTPWKEQKTRFLVAKHCFDNKSSTYQSSSMFDIFIDKEKNYCTLVRKYTTEAKNSGFVDKIGTVVVNYVQGSESNEKEIVREIKKNSEELPDNEFIHYIDYERQDIVEKFLENYKFWRNRMFSYKIEKNYFEEICSLIETKYPNGDLLMILNVERTETRYSYGKTTYRLHREIEIPRPSQLCLTIYSTQLSTSDILEMDKDEYFIPQPIMHSYNRNYGVSFEIDPETYDFIHIAQLDKKFLLFLWNKSMDKLEIYFDIITRLQKTLKEQAVNEPKGLIAIYDYDKGVLNAYSFDEERVNLHLQYRHILIQQWYNTEIPQIAHFFFIKNTENICFVENNGRARIYNLINDNFRPGMAQLPINSSRIMSTPDGSCIVAFVKEKLGNDNNEDDDSDLPNDAGISENEEATEKIPTDFQENQQIPTAKLDYNSTNNEIIRGFVFFFEKFSQNANKIIEIPFKNPSVELFQFSLFEKRQLHLVTIDQYSGSYHSAMVKITHAKTRYRFERQSKEKSLGKVKIETCNPFIVLGQDTKFAFEFQAGDFLVIGNEKSQIEEIISDNKLKISNRFKSIDFNKWHDFIVQPRITVNGLLDVYSMVFTKYAISSPIGKIDDPLSLTIVIDQAINDRESIGQYNTNFQKYIKKLFEKFKKDTKKPLGHLENFHTTCTALEILDLESNFTLYQFGDWIIEFFCLIPIQIAIARDNEFIPLQDGIFSQEIEKPMLDDGFGLIGSVSRAISFGWYESIFDYYASLEVKVISSMGEQSCGLASIERSAQEETFLQLLNAALSNLVLFKSQFAVSRDISSMFQRFQDGTNYFGDDSDIFQARFCIVIKDVAKSDRSDIVTEFQSKFSRIVDREEEDNFITKLYRNKMSILPWPVFTEAAFYTSIKTFKTKLDAQESQYKNAQMFVEKIKYAIGATLITMRTLELKKFLGNAISLGYEQEDDDPFSDQENHDVNQIKCLMSRDDKTPISDDDISLSDTFDHVDSSIKLMPDTGLELLKDKGNFVEISAGLREYFEKNVYARGSIPDSEWIDHLDKFFKLIVNRRINRVREWYARNLSRFSQDHNEIVIANYALDQEISRLNLFWNACRLRCDKCGYACLKASRHDDNRDDINHDCLTDHLCRHLCDFEASHTDEVLPQCQNFAAHQGKHRCPLSHACGAPCVHIGKRNCQNLCAKDVGHQEVSGNETHLCESTRHYCGTPCSLTAKTQKGKYECRNTCIIPCEEEHKIHKCQNEVCPIECPIENCRQRCESSDHFHALEENVGHFCSNEHQCPKECEENGICKIVTEPSAIIKEEAEYVNKLPCCVKIPPYTFEHKGKHVHEIKKAHVCDSTCPDDEGKHINEEEGKQNFHYCDEKCPNCAYYCTLPYDHGKKHNTEHSTVHGNMLLTTFTCEDDEFEFEGHQLNVGDRGDFVLCHKVCTNLYNVNNYEIMRKYWSSPSYRLFKDPAVCPGGGKKEGLLEHINANIGPNPSKKKDYISHRVFWERTKFQDPYSKDDKEEFKKCDHECADEKHHKIDEFSGKEPTKSYCTQEIFHPPLSASSKPPGGVGYISTDGHQFLCENPTTNVGNFHIVFVVDRSGSMSSGDCRPRCDNSKTSPLQATHNNRLGAVYDAIYTFIDIRMKSRKATTTGLMATDKDTASLVLFDYTAITAFKNRSLSNPDELLQIMQGYHPQSGTYYHEGIKKAAEVIETYYDPSRTNVIIFLSDGEYHPPEPELRSLCQREKDRGTYLYLYTIMFTGSSTHTRYGQSLQKMADIATEYLPKNAAKESLKCQYVLAINEVTLTEHFTQVAESLRSHKPMLIRK